MSDYIIGSRWYQFYSNGYRYDTIIKIISKYKVEMAGAGIVSKKWLAQCWYKIN